MQKFFRPAKLFYISFSQEILGSSKFLLTPVKHPFIGLMKSFSTEQKMSVFDFPSYKEQLEEAKKAYAEDRFQESVELFSKLLDKIIKAQGEQHKDVSDILYYQGKALYATGNLEEPIEVFLRGLKILKSLFGENYSDSPRFYLSIGDIYERKGKNEEALVYYEKARDISSLYGPSHPSLRTAWESIGRIQTSLGLFDEAYESLTKSHEILVGVSREKSLDIAKSHLNIGKLLKIQGKYNTLEKRQKRPSSSKKYFI